MSRGDVQIISDWVAPGSRILDLACGDGQLLHELQREKQVSGYGLEINARNIEACIERGVNVIEQNLDCGLGNFRDGSFDTVIMTQALQVMHFPHLVLEEMLRVGRACIVTFPNFGHWRCRFYLAAYGRMPVSKFMPYTWYDTPNIHFCTFSDFEALCQEKHYRVLNRMVVDQSYKSGLAGSVWPNLMGEVAIYHLTTVKGETA
ncbi:methionine biosynthesis protein MetW [Endozoicomonas sp. SCSIO W0465]|uniref:methionine biosynthesis protein MetW n=1 Tax=Endozoicomonas sp. SCSIO W0465 TaxID=2918516 RepID=UPI0020761D21|nr:methionine biosynthesis protein MetW [Endozoicomonas sp. SCSIO W0465]USE36545.1 methionine biosynthesis protein MetW [Endozoicomonas sp. SCSIO W0465]